MDPTQPDPRDEDPTVAGSGPIRPAELIAGDFLLTLNPVDGSGIEPCPPGRQPVSSRSYPEPAGSEGTGQALLERDEQRERLRRLLSRGRSVRITGTTGSGRTALLSAVAQDCADLAPDGLIQLSGSQRTPSDLRYELYAAAYHTPGYRPRADELRGALREIGAVVVIDDIEFGGTALDELLDGTPECAYLVSASPRVPVPAEDSRLEELELPGLSRTAGLEALEQLARRPVSDAEADWAGDLWLANEGLPLRFVQAGAVLQKFDAGRTGELPQPGRVIATLASTLGEGAQEALRLAVALGGAMPAAPHLPALTREPSAGVGHAQLAEVGLITATGAHWRLADGAAQELTEAGLADPASLAERVLTAAQHYTWWLSETHPRAELVAEEAEVLTAVARAAQRTGQLSAVAALARAAAPLLAGAQRWGAWERMLRTGQECARNTGYVADQAYFHHELGVLAICQEQLDRARAELEASIALRGVLADSGGVHTGRRALALVDDLTLPARPTGVATAPAPPSLPGTMPSGPAESEAQTTRLPVVTKDEPPARARGLRALAVSGTRRNAAAAGAGAVLAAVLGTVVTLGLAGESEPADGKPTSEPAVDHESDTPGPPADPDTAPAEESTDEDDTTEPSENTEPSAEETALPEETDSEPPPADSAAPEESSGPPDDGGPGTPGPTDPGTTEPGPSDPGPSDPDPTDPGPTDPDPTDPDPTDPDPEDPGPTDPEPEDPEPEDPDPPDPSDSPSDPSPSTGPTTGPDDPSPQP